MKRVILLLLLIGCVYDPEGVRYVIDGDTFVLNNGETVRLLGIDTPERGDINYNRAAYELQRRIAGRELELEGEENDRYGRSLREVFVNEDHVNVDMVRSGWARAYLHKGSKYELILEEVQLEAQQSRRGIWNVEVASYQRLSHRCVQLGCPTGSVAVASKNGNVFYNCICSAAYRISLENLECFENVHSAIAQGLRESKRC